MLKLKNLVAFFLVVLAAVSCEGEDAVTINDDSPQIYYRWTEDLTYPSFSDGNGCTTVAGSYNNTHPGIPDLATQNHFYGPLEAGQFSINLSSIGGGVYNGELQAPAAGYRRYYTHKMKEYRADVNRCLIVYLLSYYDEPIQ